MFFGEKIERTKGTYYEALAASSAGWQDGESDYVPFVTYMLGVLTACYKELDQRFALASASASNEEMLRAAFSHLFVTSLSPEIQASVAETDCRRPLLLAILYACPKRG